MSLSREERIKLRRQEAIKRRKRKRYFRIGILVVAALLILLLSYLLVKGIVGLFTNNNRSSSNLDNVEVVENVEQLPTDKKTLIEQNFEYPERFESLSGINVPYPEDGVKGIYLSAYGFANQQVRDQSIKLLKDSNLNSVVIDLKEDSGAIVSNLETEHPWILENTQVVYDMESTMQIFEENQIYPIARIVVFRDNILSQNYPEHSFKNADGTPWVRANGDLFSNPFSREVWEYNVEVAKAAAKAGFKEIQFDYIRYPETFGSIHEGLTFDMGVYEGSTEDLAVLRVRAINEFLDYARKELEPYDVKIGVDIFGYTATVSEDSDIGQNFSEMSERVDVVSSMIYPSHWGVGYFGLDYPDKYPYEVTKEYMKIEEATLSELENPPITRPWLQDFTASYLGAGAYINYGVEEVLDQTRALREAGVEEFLLWNASNTYSTTNEY